MSHIVIGMAGHIDHGKTALIRALTGIETDRLPQEKERGITIDIGFAYWKDNVTIIDVPGHEKFIRNMVAGVSTVHTFLLVIAADDGIMPQTREHLEILRFFGVTNGIVALNKADLVDEEWLELMQTEVETFLEEEGFGRTPVFPVSAETGEGIDALRTALEAHLKTLSVRHQNRPFRLTIDRSFFIKGFGNVVTGTVLSGTLTVNDQLDILPDGIRQRVRGLEVHQKAVHQAVEGQRTAVNLTATNRFSLKRGQVLTAPESLVVSRELFVVLHTTALFQFKIKRFSQVRVHLGTSELKATLNWFEEEPVLQPRRTYHMHLKIKEDAVAAPGDAVLLRSFSPAATLGGGTVLQLNPPHLKHNRDDWQNYFNILETGSLPDRLLLHFKYGGFRSFSVQQLGACFFESADSVQTALNKLKKQKLLSELSVEAQPFYVLNEQVDALIARMIQTIEAQLSGEMSPGLKLKEIEALMISYRPEARFFQLALQRAVNRKQLHFDGLYYQINGREAGNSVDKLKQRVCAAFKEKGFSPPDLAKLSLELNLPKSQLSKIIQLLLSEGTLRSVAGQFYLHHDVWNAWLQFLKNYFSKKPRLGVADIRDFTGSSRKYLIPLLEFSDQQELTLRQGDERTAGPKLQEV